MPYRLKDWLCWYQVSRLVDNGDDSLSVCRGVVIWPCVFQSAASGKDFECIELGDLGNDDEDERKEKPPRRIIHFSSGETMEEYSTDEEEEEDEKEPEKKDLLSPVDTSTLTWGPYVWFQMWRAATSTISACDYLGERMASLFGITTAKYQYAIDEYYRIKKEKEEEEEDNRLSEEAERYFEEQQEQQQQQCSTSDDDSNSGGRRRDLEPEMNQPHQVNHDTIDQDPSAPTTIHVPVIVTST
ncbi:protein FAM177A1-like isoform X2 [Engraulis encrasicolus]|uniref:protein FAM177A1-like isoform X2 n=1 Tax=Engraulis encrasicolus TaxID=184585 RepID=UPI002FD5D57A